MSRQGVALTQLRRAVGRHRRLLAAVLAAAAMATALTALRPEPPATVRLAVASTDLTAGATLRAADVDIVALPTTSVPDGAVTETTQLVGQVLSTPMRRGEPFTDLRLASTTPVSGYGEGKVGAPVRIADPGIAGLLRPGSVVDILAVQTAGGLGAEGPAKVIAAEVRVVALPTTDSTPTGGTLVVVAATPGQATALARNATNHLSLTLHD